MALFGSIGKFIGGAAKKIVKTVTNPAKLTTAVLTGGLSVAAPKIAAPLTSAVQSTLFNPQLALSLLSKNPIGAATALQGGGNMGLDLGGIFGSIGSIFGGNQNPIFNGISGIANIAQQFVPPTGAPNMSTTQLAARPLLPAAAGAVRTIGRGFFAKYPNLATAIQGYRNMGKNVTRAKLWSLVKRFGPELVISGGILTAAAVSELMVAGPGRRRMNPANVKALRRSLRRMESFHKLCARVDRLRPHRRGSRKSAGSSTFVRQG
jgi:hypothetical protein